MKNPTDEDLYALSEKLIRQASERNLTVTSAESCTGGWIAKCLTDIDGSSAAFPGSFVTYSNLQKMRQLGVAKSDLQAHGAVSEAVVLQMADGARKEMKTDMAVSVSGVAGPGGGSADKPVGTVWFGLALKGRETLAAKMLFENTGRDGVRRQSVAYALTWLLNSFNI